MKGKVTALLPLCGLLILISLLGILYVLGPLASASSPPPEPYAELPASERDDNAPLAAAVCPDPYEPNDNFANAWSLSPGTIQSYICTANDLDYYKFSVNAGDWIHLDLYGLSVNCNLWPTLPPEENLLTSPTQ